MPASQNVPDDAHHKAVGPGQPAAAAAACHGCGPPQLACQGLLGGQILLLRLVQLPFKVLVPAQDRLIVCAGQLPGGLRLAVLFLRPLQPLGLLDVLLRPLVRLLCPINLSFSLLVGLLCLPVLGLRLRLPLPGRGRLLGLGLLLPAGLVCSAALRGSAPHATRNAAVAGQAAAGRWRQRRCTSDPSARLSARIATRCIHRRQASVCHAGGWRERPLR